MVRPSVTPVLIAGPTGSGKSKLALLLAKKFGGEIICADSRQFYAGMTIGTAGPTVEDLKDIPHHGYGMFEPNFQKMDAGLFVRFAQQKIVEITSRKKRPILVGGTGLYLRALYYGLSDVPPSDKSVLEEISRQCDRFGLGHLYATLQKVDSLTAALIEPNDRYRIQRALEIYALTNRPPSELRKSFAQEKSHFSAHCIYKKPEKSALITTIEKRVHKMFASGLVEEAKRLRNHLSPGHWALKVMGYQEALQVLDNLISLDDAILRTIIRHRQYAKRQYTWFNREPFFRFVVS